MRIAPAPLLLFTALGMSGCQGPLSTDSAIGTLPVPQADTDCQIRISSANVEGGGIAVQGSGSTRIVSVIGARNCSQEMLDEALGIRRVPAVGIENRLRRLERSTLGIETQ